MTDPIAEMLTIIRNAVLVKKPDATMPFSKIKLEVGKILEREGFIVKVEKVPGENPVQPLLRLTLKYRDKQPVINGIKKISKSGQKVYRGYKEIPKHLPSLGVQIISTSRGLMTNQEARDAKIGGEVLCEID